MKIKAKFQLSVFVTLSCFVLYFLSLIFVPDQNPASKSDPLSTHIWQIIGFVGFITGSGGILRSTKLYDLLHSEDITKWPGC